MNTVMVRRCWVYVAMILMGCLPRCHPVAHKARANRILDRITNFIAGNADTASKAKLLGILMNVTDPNTTLTTTTVATTTTDPVTVTTEANDKTMDLIEPIDDLLMQAADPGTAFNEPEFIPNTDIVKFDGDILMRLKQFAKLQRRVVVNLFEEALVKNMSGNSKNTTLMDWIQSKVQSASSRQKRAGRRDSRRYWRNGVVPIRIAGRGFSSRHKRRIAISMNHISKATCICFRIISARQARRRIPHVRIVDGNGCRSYVGVSVRRQGGTISQDLTLGRRCRRPRISTHEFLHVLGLFHEQSRSDRNDYVDIRMENIIPRNRGNFNRFGPRTIDTRGIPYDYLSIMHYSNRAFSVNGEYTIVPKPEKNRKKYLSRIGRSRFMSDKDIALLNLMYNCPKRHSGKRPTCSHYPYRFPSRDRW